MIGEEPIFAIDPWPVAERGPHLDRLAQTESVFALSHGHIGLRGNLDEGEPFGDPGTYLNAFYETRPLSYAEAAYGYPATSQTLINVTNGKVLCLLVDTFELARRKPRPSPAQLRIRPRPPSWRSHQRPRVRPVHRPRSM